jgi:hypothetical protein
MWGDTRARLGRIVVSVGVVVALAAPATASATVTIGSNLGRAPQLSLSCFGGPCTFALSALDNPVFAATGGVTAPVNGTVTTWRIRAGGGTTATAFRVVRPLGGGLFTGAGTSATVTPPASGTTAYSTQIPIKTGDLIGINCCDEVTGSYFRISDGDTHQWFAPGLADGGAGEPPDDNEGELLVNADIEPTSAFTVNGVQRSKHGKLLVTATLPNPGTLAAGDQKVAVLSASAAKKKKPKLLKRSSVQVGGPTSTQLLVFPTKAAKVLLNEGKKVKAGLKLSFTPTGGTASTQIIKLKLRP